MSILTDLQIPVLQAPMAGTATPALAIATSRAGGLGGMGLATGGAAQAAARHAGQPVLKAACSDPQTPISGPAQARGVTLCATSLSSVPLSPRKRAVMPEGPWRNSQHCGSVRSS